MGKKVQDSGDKEKVHKNTKAHRLDQVEEPVDSDKHTWPSVIFVIFRMLLSIWAIFLMDSKNSSLKLILLSMVMCWESN